MVSGTMPADLEAYMDADDPTEAGDIKIVGGSVTEISDCDTTTGWTMGTAMFFQSGGTHQVLAGDTLTGATSGATCVVDYVILSGGTWAGGTAYGYFLVSSLSATNFVWYENINEGANSNVCTVTGLPIASDELTLELDTSTVQEGTGSIKVRLPITTAAYFLWTGSAVDLSACDFLKFGFKHNGSSSWLVYAMFGETDPWENVSSLSIASAGSWYTKTYDISAIASASRDQVIKVAVPVVNNSYSGEYDYWIDYVRAEPGPSEIKSYDGHRVSILYPKVLTSYFTGTGSNLDIPLDRKGTPTSILICSSADGSLPCTWITGMGNYSKLSDGTTITTGIKSVIDCGFSIGASTDVNYSGSVYRYAVFWSD